MLTRFRFDSGRVARKGSVGTVTVKQASGQPDRNPHDTREDRVYDALQLHETEAWIEGRNYRKRKSRY